MQNTARTRIALGLSSAGLTSAAAITAAFGQQLAANDQSKVETVVVTESKADYDLLPNKILDTPAIRAVTGTRHRIRTDVSATLFLSEPDSYDGGELVIEDRPGIKLPAGDMLVYPATSLHRVTPVTRGERVAAFFWVQSLVKDAAERAALFQLDRSVQSLSTALGANQDDVLRLTGLYHNLVRKWGTV